VGAWAGVMATPVGSEPGPVDTLMSVFVAVAMTDTSLEPLSVTNTDAPSGATATPSGSEPTPIGVVVPDARSTASTVLTPSLTYAVLPSGVMAMPRGCVTGIGVPTTFVATSIGITSPAPAELVTYTVFPSGATARLDSEPPGVIGVPMAPVARSTGSTLLPTIT